MEWNTKWDWENIDIFNSKDIASPKKLQPTDWGIEDGEEDIDGSFNSISASTESSFKEGTKGSNFSFEGFGCFPDAYTTKKEFDRSDVNGTSPLEASVCSGEPFIGLKLGKRTYFENSYAKSNTKMSSQSGIPISSVSTAKKVKSSYTSTPIPRCQVEGCNLDLSSAKEYHRKHRVCESHSKCPKVIVAGLERRFCQQCSRFHSMLEFDEEKRSCRRRLSDHNARRRKPQQETIRFNTTIPYSTFYDTPLVQTRPIISSTWESEYSVVEVKAEKPGDHSIGVQLPHAVPVPTLAFNGLVPLPSKGARAEIFDQGLKESTCSNVDAVDIRRALSLLSNNSWGPPCDPNFFPLDHGPMHNAVPQGFPLSSPDYWQPNPRPVYPLPTKTTNANAHAHFPEFQIFKAPYETLRFYSTPMDDILKP